MFLFIWKHKHIDEIRTNILGYDKNGVKKHIKATARVKVELPNMRDDV